MKIFKIILLLLLALPVVIFAQRNDAKSSQIWYPFNSGYEGQTNSYTQLDSVTTTVNLPQQQGDLLPFFQINHEEDSGSVNLEIIIEASLFNESGTQYWEEISRDTVTADGVLTITDADLTGGAGATDWRIKFLTQSSGSTGQWTNTFAVRWLPRTSTSNDYRGSLLWFPYNGNTDRLTSSVTTDAAETLYIDLPQQNNNTLPVIQVQYTEVSGSSTADVIIQASYFDESGTQYWDDVATISNASDSATQIFTLADLATGEGATDWRVKCVQDAGSASWTFTAAARWLPRN